MSIALALNVFPGIAHSPERSYDPCRAISDGSTLWIFVAEGNEVVLAESFTVTNIESLDAMRYNVTDEDGNVWLIESGGGCGCGSPLKRANWQSLLANIGVEV